MFYVPSPIANGITEGTEAVNCKFDCDSPLDNDYENEWQTLTREKDIKALKSRIVRENLSSSSIRSVYWRVLLGIFPVEFPTEWLNIVRKSRKQYSEIKNNFTLDPRTTSNVPDDNPLSQDENSAWHKYFCDTELKKLIKQDVVRTSPEKDFFQQLNIQEIMVNILFYYARQNPDICYRQGMHEILAPLLLVMYEDYIAFEQAKQISVINSFIEEIMDSNYLEADAFWFFSLIMSHMAKYYEVNSVPTPSGHFPLPNFSEEKNKFDNHPTESSISSHLNCLKDNMLSVCDRKLYDHLEELNIPFTAFGIRWLRLLFGREFSYNDLLILWDAIFAVHSGFDLVNYVVIAMLLAIRDKLLNSDYMECLNYLMKYPSTVDIKFVINYAMYLKDPKSQQKPLLPQSNVKSTEEFSLNGDDSINKLDRLKNNSNKHLNITKRFKNLKINSSKKNSKENDLNFIDECSSKSFEVVVTELKHMRVVMSLCKLKLYQYQEILTTSVSPEDIKAQQALTGIQELCTLLDIDHFSLKPSPNNCTEIETAREAGEVQLTYPECSNNLFLHPTIDAVALYLPPPKTDIDMEIFKRTECETTDYSKFPAENPLKPDKYK